MRRLPRSTRDLHGLRARRYIRVSSEEQGWKYGPEGQHLTVDEVVARHGLVEVGEPFVDEQSAWQDSESRPELQRLVREARDGGFDVLVVPYFSRWSRDAEVALRLRRALHADGVAILFADEDFVSSDETALERYLDEAVASEKFSLRLSRTIRKTMAAKFERFGDQGGSPGLGFIRTPQPEARLAIDPETMPRVVAIYERYAQGDVSYGDVARIFGMEVGGVRAILCNRLYNGWAVRHRRREDEVRVPAPWRTHPPVSDELWQRVADIRARRNTSSGRQPAKRDHLLAKRLWCTCGRAVRAATHQGRNGREQRRYRHDDCDRWTQRTRLASTFDDAISAQLSGIRADRASITRISARGGSTAPVDTELRRRALERELARKATEHAARRITTEAYLAEHARISAEIDGLAAEPPVRSMADPDAMAAELLAIRDAWLDADEAQRARLVTRVYERIVVEDDRFVQVELTEHAIRHGLLWALPEEVELSMARPARGGHALATPIRRTVRMPLAGRKEWLRATRAERSA